MRQAAGAAGSSHLQGNGSSCNGRSHGSRSISRLRSYIVLIVMACALWGKSWRGKTVRCRCDNAAVVAIVRSGTSKHPLVMHLMRCLSCFVAHYQVYLEPVHVPGVCNEAADALSRGNLPLFMQLMPGALQSATPIQDALRHALIESTPDWSSQAWTTVLRTILCRD